MHYSFWVSCKYQKIDPIKLRVCYAK
uniref:Uncharacterized protein n=1 Tax=Arundo donax TaxID=35708 RepID=A0A0A9BYG5_ARUDO